MRWYRPHSFFALLLTGFVFVIFPLLTALFSSVQILDGLVKQSSQTIYSSVERASAVRRVADLLLDQERKARLYAVLGEPSLLDGVNQVHLEIEEAFADLILVGNHSELSGLIMELEAMEAHIAASLNHLSGGPEQRKNALLQALDRYKRVATLMRELEHAGNIVMSDEVALLQEKVSAGKRALAWQTSGLIGFSVIFIFVFVSLISKPIQQIDKGIESLGDGDFATPIEVSGPRDLEGLGERLDWLRRRLAELDREKIKMIAHISHELKTPLSSIKEGVGLLRDELVGSMSFKQKEVVAILDKNSDKLHMLIQNILDFNMSQARKIPVKQEELRIDEIIKKVVADHRNSMLARKISMDIKLEQLIVRGDREQLKTVFDNLLSNAVKFTPDGGEIKARLVEDEEKVVFQIDDSGAGVDKEDRARIFSPFFQGKEAKKAIVKGSGLGLAIVREYVQNHGGSIRLLPSKKGASFSVFLPS